jgi:hypothetical protein
MKLVVLTQGAVNTAALQRLNGTMFFSEPEAIETLAACADCGLPEDDPEYRDAMRRELVQDGLEWYENMAEVAEALNDIDADRLIGSGYFVAVDWYDTVKSKAAAVRHVVSDHEHLDDDTKLAEWYDKVVDNEICYHSDDALSDTWFTVVDAFTYTALCYVLELVHEAICDGKEM